MSRHSITSRMQALRVDVEPDVEERQIAVMLGELREVPLTPVPVTARPARRRLMTALAVAFALLLPTAALAAEDAVPGDVLYPVKQSTEWVRSLIDPTVVQEHRVDELEIVIDRGAPIDVIVDRFDASVDAVDELDPELIQRVERARETVRERYGVDLAPTVARSGPGAPIEPSDTGNGQTSRSGSEQHGGDGATDTSSPAMTTTSTEPPATRAGTGYPGTGGTTTPSTKGQPDDSPEPGSAGNRP